LDGFDRDFLKRKMEEKVASDDLVTVTGARELLQDRLDRKVSWETVRATIKDLGFR